MNGLPESVNQESEKLAKQEAEDARTSRINDAAHDVRFYAPDDSGQDFCMEMSKRILVLGQVLKDEGWDRHLDDIQSPWAERLQKDAFFEAVQILQDAVSGDENTVLAHLENVFETDNIKDAKVREAKQKFRHFVFEALRRDVMFKLRERVYSSSQDQTENSQDAGTQCQTPERGSSLESNAAYTIGQLIRDLTEYRNLRKESENNTRKQGGQPAVKGSYAAHYAIQASIADANASKVFSRIPKDVIDQIRPLCELIGEFDVKTLKTLRANICIYFGEPESSVDAMSPPEFRRLTLEGNEQRRKRIEPLLKKLTGASDGLRAAQQKFNSLREVTALIASEIYGDQSQVNTFSSKEGNQTKLGNRYEKAFQSYEYAENHLENCTDREAYDWLIENVPSEYELPAFETWKRYVRQGRNHYNANKNSPLAGRSGRSILGPEG